MTDAGDDQLEEDPRERDAIRQLLKRSLAVEALTKESPELVAGVQRRIRQRSRGRFFADGWGTTQSRVSYFLVGLMTLMVAIVAYFALGPWDMR
jgi:hypothetical protein